MSEMMALLRSVPGFRLQAARRILLSYRVFSRNNGTAQEIDFYVMKERQAAAAAALTVVLAEADGAVMQGLGCARSLCVLCDPCCRTCLNSIPPPPPPQKKCRPSPPHRAHLTCNTNLRCMSARPPPLPHFGTVSVHHLILTLGEGRGHVE